LDCELLKRIVGRDRSAFAALYDRHAAPLFGLLVRILGRRGDAEDVLQETFLQVWRDASRFDPGRGSVAGWLFLLGRSRALDHLRRRDPTPPSPDSIPEPATHPDHAAGLVRAETLDSVRRALAQLPAEQRQALCLAFYGGLTHEQVAARQGVPLGTAKTRIRLAVARLRQLLGP
jgi:RNA polymerase sigma-70 factor (ECF subfamily)